MTIYYEKAMELGNMILSSETSLRLADAQAAFDEDAAASEHYMQYEERQESLQTAISGGLLNAEQYQEQLANLVQMEIELKNRPAVREYLKAREDYDALVNSVMDVLRTTILGDGEKGCGGGCGGCGKH